MGLLLKVNIIIIHLFLNHNLPFRSVCMRVTDNRARLHAKGFSKDSKGRLLYRIGQREVQVDPLLDRVGPLHEALEQARYVRALDTPSAGSGEQAAARPPRSGRSSLHGATSPAEIVVQSREYKVPPPDSALFSPEDTTTTSLSSHGFPLSGQSQDPSLNGRQLLRSVRRRLYSQDATADHGPAGSTRQPMVRKSW